MFEGYPTTEHEERGGGHTGYNSQYAVPVYKVVALFDVFTRKKLITDPVISCTILNTKKICLTFFFRNDIIAWVIVLAR